jgi:hypothetical protein
MKHAMRWLVYILLATEVVLIGSAVGHKLESNMVVLLLAGNSVLLIWSATRLRRKPACCR